MNTLQQILVKYWGYSQFRPLQEDIINSVLQGKDTLGLMPTGGGKSIVFQVAALAKPGLCVVVTPLIALMKDQVDALKARHIKAVAINSAMTQDEISIALDNCRYGDYKFLYISPERIASDLFKARVVNMKVNLITVDEAHCISQWGYDFRPSYLRVTELRTMLPGVPVLALTATATPEVIDDIQQRLSFSTPNVFSKSFERKNLTYLVRKKEDKIQYLLKIARRVQGVGIVYVRNRRRTKEIALELMKYNIQADFYHAGLRPREREEKQARWKTSKRGIMVCTNAFGMGIDKADVRFVVHLDLPDSPEAYFQEAGRGGRDEKSAWAVLLYNDADVNKLRDSVQDAFPEVSLIRRVYDALGNYFQIPYGAAKGVSFDFLIDEFCKRYRFEVLPTYNCIKTLQQDGYLELIESPDTSSHIHFIINRDDLYKFQIKYANFDGFVKLLLRSFTGLFTDYVRFDEEWFAKKNSIPLDVLKKYLESLHKFRVINYFPAKTNPILVYTEERLPSDSILFSHQKYADRKQRYIRRTDAMLRYVSDPLVCRSQYLLHYFGEISAARCGNCDTCRKRNKLSLNNIALSTMQEAILQQLKVEPLSIPELTQRIGGTQETIIRTLRFLLENGTLEPNENGKLQIR